jgi:hypothetical protein
MRLFIYPKVVNKGEIQLISWLTLNHNMQLLFYVSVSNFLICLLSKQGTLKGKAHLK